MSKTEDVAARAVAGGACCLGGCGLYLASMAVGIAGWGAIIRLAAWGMHMAFGTRDLTWPQCFVTGFVVALVVLTLSGILSNGRRVK